jgi:hypothetical protein
MGTTKNPLRQFEGKAANGHRIYVSAHRKKRLASLATGYDQWQVHTPSGLPHKGIDGGQPRFLHRMGPFGGHSPPPSPDPGSSANAWAPTIAIENTIIATPAPFSNLETIDLIVKHLSVSA